MHCGQCLSLVKLGCEKRTAPSGWWVKIFESESSLFLCLSWYYVFSTLQEVQWRTTKSHNDIWVESFQVLLQLRQAVLDFCTRPFKRSKLVAFWVMLANVT